MNTLKNLLPVRKIDMHKGDRGRILIAGGSDHYPGAPALSALGALRSGSGVVTLLSNENVCRSCAARIPEIVYMAENNKFKWHEYILNGNNKFNAVIAGMGIDRDYSAQKFIINIWNLWPGKILIDGDGLYALAQNQSDLKFRDDAVLTPHEAEAARLMKISVEDVKNNREHVVKDLSQKFGCVVLKGHGTLIAHQNKFEKINFGGPELSVPGSGDVLAGCIGAFLGMGLEIFDAAVLGTSLHGMAGEILARDGVDGVLSSEIANTLRKAIKNLREAE